MTCKILRILNRIESYFIHNSLSHPQRGSHVGPRAQGHLVCKPGFEPGTFPGKATVI